MRMTPTCVACIFNQALRVCETLKVDATTTKAVLDAVGCMIPEWHFDETPPQVAARSYPKIAEILQTDDIYRHFKQEATEHAKAFLPLIQKRIDQSNDRFMAALKAAVAGNVIDLAAVASFDLEEEVNKVFDTPFAIDDSEGLRNALQNARTLLVVGDNAGEHLFDKAMMATFKQLYPQLHIYYAVRGAPIINDVTMADASAAKIDEVAEIIDSGVDTPGLDLARINEEMRQIYENSDVVLAKGMGNYESLNDISTRSTWYLLKVKCDVVAASLKRRVGDIVCCEGVHSA